MNKLIPILLSLVAIIHLLPVSGVLGAERLTVLYGIEFNEPNIEILMRHRAVLFCLLGVFFVYAAFKPSVQPIAVIAGLVNVLSFMAIAYSVGGFNDSIRTVFLADIVAAVGLVLAGVAYVVKDNNGWKAALK